MGKAVWVVLVGIAAVLAFAYGRHTAWVVQSVDYHGPKGGGGVHSVTCVRKPNLDPEGAKPIAEQYRTVTVFAATARSLKTGDTCP